MNINIKYLTKSKKTPPINIKVNIKDIYIRYGYISCIRFLNDNLIKYRRINLIGASNFNTIKEFKLLTKYDRTFYGGINIYIQKR